MTMNIVLNAGIATQIGCCALPGISRLIGVHARHNKATDPEAATTGLAVRLTKVVLRRASANGAPAMATVELLCRDDGFATAQNVRLNVQYVDTDHPFVSAILGNIANVKDSIELASTADELGGPYTESPMPLPVLSPTTDAVGRVEINAVLEYEERRSLFGMRFC